MPGCTPFQKPARATAKRWRGLRDTEVPDGCAALPGARPSPLDYKHQVGRWAAALGGRVPKGFGPRRGSGPWRSGGRAEGACPAFAFPRWTPMLAASCGEVPVPQRRGSVLVACPIAPRVPVPRVPVPLRRVRYARSCSPRVPRRRAGLPVPLRMAWPAASAPRLSGLCSCPRRGCRCRCPPARFCYAAAHIWEEDGDDCTVGEAQRSCRQGGGV